MFFFNAILSLCLFLPNVLFGKIHLEPCQFGLQAEFLYLKPSNPYGYGLLITPPNNIENVTTDPDYKPGFRIEGIYALNCQHVLHSRITYFKARYDDSETGTFFTPNFTGTLKTKFKYRYIAYEVLFGSWFFDCCNFDLELEVGFVYANIKFDEERIATGTPAVRTTFNNSKFWGIGPEIVVNFEYPIPCFSEFAIDIDLRGALLSSSRKSSAINTGVFTFPVRRIYEIVPATDLRFGLSWNHGWSCLKTNLEVGYEWIFYHNSINNHIVYTQPPVSNATFQGPYLALGVAF